MNCGVTEELNSGWGLQGRETAKMFRKAASDSLCVFWEWVATLSALTGKSLLKVFVLEANSTGKL